MAGYHINQIPKGSLGYFSKVKEEYLEFLDAMEQDSHIMAIVELSDLVGSIKKYLTYNDYENEWNSLVSYSDVYLVTMKDLKESFHLLEKDNKINIVNYRSFMKVLNSYLKQYNLGLKDVIKMSEITERAFKNGYR